MKNADAPVPAFFRFILCGNCGNAGRAEPSLVGTDSKERKWPICRVCFSNKLAELRRLPKEKRHKIADALLKALEE